MSACGDLPGPAITVHWLAQAEAALSAAAAAGRPVTLLSAPLAVFSIGPLYFREMVRLARERVPQAESLAVLDCGGAAGRALEALHGGVEAVVFTGSGPACHALAEIAAKSGARLLLRRPESLDLLELDEPQEACLAWLACGTARR